MTDLTPAAQAVMDAAYEELDYVPQRHVRWCAAAALRAAVDQVVPLHICGTNATRAQTRLGIRHKLLAIANELENHQ